MARSFSVTDGIAFERSQRVMDEAGGLLTVAETARMLRRSTEQVRRYLREGVLPGRRVGGQWFIQRADADAFLLRRPDGSDFLRGLASSAPDPLGDVVALGGSGGAAIAQGRVAYLRGLAWDDGQTGHD